MPRGGSRKGAGRRAVLSAEERLWVWQQCQRLKFVLTKIKHARQTQAYWSRFDRSDDDLHFSALQRSWKTMETWTPETRRRALIDEDEETPEGALLRDAILNSSAVAAAHPHGRWHHIKLTRLSNGERSKIAERVARRATDRFGKRVTGRRVRDVWEGLNAALKSS